MLLSSPSSSALGASKASRKAHVASSRVCVARSTSESAAAPLIDRRAALVSGLLVFAPAANAALPAFLKPPPPPPPGPSAESVVKKVVEGLKKNNSKALLGAVTNTVIWDLPSPSEAGDRKGLVNVTRYFDRIKALEKFGSFTPKKFVVDTKQRTVDVFGSSAATVLKTGKDYKSDWVMTFEVDNAGRISKVRQYVDTKAIAAAYS